MIQGLLVGHSQLCRSLSHLLPDDVRLTDTTTHLSGSALRQLQGQGGYFWERDLQVISPFSGTIPLYGLKAKNVFLNWAKEQFPSLEDLDKIPQIPQQGLRYSEDNTIVYLEGGNVLFYHHNDRPGALIGVTSVLLTMEKMEKRRQLTGSNKEKWEWALEEIAKVLGISKENLIVLEHNLNGEGICIHIDLTVLVGPRNTVFLNHHVGFLSQERAQIDREITKRNCAALEACGLTVKCVCGYDPNLRAYFLNALLFRIEERYVFVTLAGQSQQTAQLASIFSLAMHNEGIDVVYVPLQSPLLGGGIHCLTQWQQPSSTSPQAIAVRSFAENIPTPGVAGGISASAWAELPGYPRALVEQIQ